MVVDCRESLMSVVLVMVKYENSLSETGEKMMKYFGLGTPCSVYSVEY